MKKIIVLLLIILVGCQCQPTYKQSQINFILINGNLYTDRKDNIYIKATDDTQNNHPKTVYISRMFIYGKEKPVLLKKIIDKNSYQKIENSLYSKDKNNIYFLRKTLEGGGWNYF